MAQRITRAFLETQVENLNRLMKTPTKPYSNVDGVHKANPGNYHIDSAYDGYQLVQMCTSGGERNVLNIGFVSATKLSEAIGVYMSGLRDMQDAMKAEVTASTADFALPQFAIKMAQNKGGKRLFNVTYGQSAYVGLSYAEAAETLGECVFHALACDGKINNEGA